MAYADRVVNFQLEGYLPEVDASGKEKWPKGEEKVWKSGMRGLDTGAP